MAELKESPSLGLVPVNAKAYLSFLLSGKGPEQSDFSQEDLATLRQSALRKYQETGQPEGVLSYGDYNPNGRVSSVEQASLPDTVLQSYRDPAFRLESTLGQAKYAFRPDGRVQIDDAYDFAALPQQLNAALKEKGFLRLAQSAIREKGFWGLLNLLGNMRAGQTEGKPYSLQLGRE